MFLTIGAVIMTSLAVFLQVKLAKEDNPRYSLMLPLLFFISSFIVTVFMIYLAWGNFEAVVVFALSAFLISNIPTILMFITRYIVRRK